MKKLYLTFDMDWANDDVLNWFLDEMDLFDIVGTLNVTHHTYVLDRIRKERRFELGIHPNFNPLLTGETGNMEDIVKELKSVVPEAVSMRAHALVCGTRISNCLYEHGIRIESNCFYRPKKGMVLDCYEDYFGMVHVPYFFEDDESLINSKKIPIRNYLEDYNVPLVFNFHPIHLFLNTEDIRRYEESKKYMKNYFELKKMINSGNGTKNLFEELITLAKEHGYRFCQLKEIIDV